MFLAMVTLLGAGFSKNYGLPLASDIGHRAASFLASEGEEGYAKQILSGANYEVLVGKLRDEDADGYRKVRRAALRALESMDTELCCELGIHRPEKQFKYEDCRALLKQLALLGPIFTTNQDLLIERTYTDGNARPMHLSRPGVREIDGSRVLSSSGCDSPLGDPSPSFQPDAVTKLSVAESGAYVKLHGSLDWSQGNGSNMIIGLGKEWQLADNGILGEYLALFKRTVAQASRLLIIGYSFADAHLNSVISQAVNSTGLKLFIWDPCSIAGLKERLNDGSKSMVDCWSGVIGLCQENLCSRTHGNAIKLFKLADIEAFANETS